jgi:hypothetical protein
VSFNDEYWLWTQDISLRFNAITLLHGGLGHRPLLQRVNSLQIFLNVFKLSLPVSFFLIWEGTCDGLSMIYWVLQCQVPRTTPCLSSILSLSHLQTFLSMHTSPISLQFFLSRGVPGRIIWATFGLDYPGARISGPNIGWIIRPYGPSI